MEQNNESTRINRYLASCGIGSRRDCDAYLEQGLIRVNGEIAKPGDRLFGTEDITFRGEPVEPMKAKEYFLYHKPKGPICTARDPQGRETIYDSLKAKDLDAPYLKYVGRLDLASEGALILTNDGDMLHALTHPRFQIKKVYQVKVEKLIPDETQRMIVEDGVESDGDILTVGAIRYKGAEDRFHWYELDLYEGKNRQIRRVFEAIGLEVKRLIRTQFANIKLRDLPVGEYRLLEEREVQGLVGKGHEVDRRPAKKPASKPRSPIQKRSLTGKPKSNRERDSRK